MSKFYTLSSIYLGKSKRMLDNMEYRQSGTEHIFSGFARDAVSYELTIDGSHAVFKQFNFREHTEYYTAIFSANEPFNLIDMYYLSFEEFLDEITSFRSTLLIGQVSTMRTGQFNQYTLKDYLKMAQNDDRMVTFSRSHVRSDNSKAYFTLLLRTTLLYEAIKHINGNSSQ